MSDIYSKIDEFCKLAEEDSNDLFGGSGSAGLKRHPQEILDQREYNEKYREIHLLLLEIKRLADIVDYRYKNFGKPKGLNKVIDFDYWGSLLDLKKVRKILLNRTEKLDNFSIF